MRKLHLILPLLISYILFQTQYQGLGQTSLSSDYFRSLGTGNWNSTNSWESSTDGSTNWIPATLIPTEAANVVTIRNAHTVTINTNTTVDQVVVANGAILELATGPATTLTVNDGAGNDIIIQNGGTFKHNLTAPAPVPSFAGAATLEVQSGGTIEAANNNGNPSDYAVAGSSISSHVVWNDNSIFNWNNTSPPSSGVTYFPTSAAIPVFRFSAAATIGGASPTVINGLLEATANVSFSNSGTKTIRNGIIGTAAVTATAPSVGQFIINGSAARLGGGTLVLPDAGMLISAGTDLALMSNKTINKVNTTVSTIDLFGTLICADYIIDGNSKIQIDGTVKTSNPNGLTGGATTTFATGFTVNSFGGASTIEYNRVGNQIVTPLSYTNLTISGSGTKAAGAADVFVSGTLNVSAANTFALNGTNHLKLNGGGTLNINPNAIFDTGGESQITGGGSPTINISGTFICRDAQGFTGTNTSIPGATSTPTITLNINTGSIIEYARAGDQPVTSRDDYKSLTFSGSGTKTVGTFNPIGTVTIKDNAIVNASNKKFGDTTATNLTMTGGRFIVAGTNTKPDIAGSYNLAGGIIEFAGGTAATRQNIRSTPTYLNIEVSGFNVGNSTSTTKLANGGSFTVKTGGSYENSGDKIDGTSGIQTFIMEAGSIFKTGVTGGFSGSTSAALNNIESITVDPKSTIIYSRSGDQTITAFTGYPTLLLKGSGIKTVTSGNVEVAINADSVVIDPLVVLKVAAGAKANLNNCHVYVHSASSGTGIIGEITDGASALLNATNVTIERFIPARRAFRFLSPAVTTSGSIKDNWMEGQNNPPPAYSVNNNNNPGYGTHITGSADPTNGFDATATNNASIFTFDNTGQLWQAVPKTGNPLVAATAYRLLVRGSRSVDLASNTPSPSNTILRTTGSLVTGPVTFNESSTPSISGNAGSYSFLGNPYPSPVDWDALARPGLSPYYYVWDPNLNTRGAYVTYGNSITTPAGSAVDQNIQQGQAFFVRTISANPSITFAETNKTTTNKNIYRTSSAIATLSIQLLLDTASGSEHTADGVTLFFDDSFSTSIGNEDAAKINNLDENVSVVRDYLNLSIEGRPAVKSADTIPLKIEQFRQKNYYLKFKPSNFPESVSAVLEDHLLKKEVSVDLSSGQLHPFSVTNDPASFASDRFTIFLKSTEVLPVTITDVKAYKKERGIQVEWQLDTETGIEKYEVEKLIQDGKFNKIGTVPVKPDRSLSEKYYWFDADVNTGDNFYRIKCLEKAGTSRYSKVVNVKAELERRSITVSPNPIFNNQVTIQMKNTGKSVFTISIYNNVGQKVYTGSISHDGSTGSYKVLTGKILKGNYKLYISNATETFSENIVFE